MIMPVLFVGHGNPMNAISENEFVGGFRTVAKALPRPRAILCISAHWETAGTMVTAMRHPRTIHDFGGFPPELYKVQYPAQGSPQLADEISSLVTGTDIGSDLQWGLDHGCWSVVKHLFPAADIPVVQLSLDYTKPARFHYDLGRELTALRHSGVLIIGSGNIVHNLGLVDWNNLDTAGFGFDWAMRANTLFRKLIDDRDHDALINYHLLGNDAALAIPTPEHFLPLLHVIALQESDDTLSIFNDKPVAGSLTMTSLHLSR